MSKTEQPSPDTPAPSKLEVNAFVRAAGSGDIDAVREFIAAYPEYVDAAHQYAQEANQSMAGQTALAAATQVREPEIMQLLVDAGADVNKRNEHGIAPLAYACFTLNKEGTRILLDNGVDLNVGETTIGLISYRATHKVFSLKTQETARAMLGMINEEREKRRKAAEKLQRDLERQRFPGVLQDTAAAPQIKLKPRKPPQL